MKFIVSLFNKIKIKINIIRSNQSEQISGMPGVTFPGVEIIYSSSIVK